MPTKKRKIVAQGATKLPAMKTQVKEHEIPLILSTGPGAFQEPQKDTFINPWNDQVLLKYFHEISQWHGYIRFLGLPNLKENPDVRIQHLYVEPYLAKDYIPPDRALEEWTGLQNPLDVLCEHPRVMLLGDPGCGKSTLINWVAWQFIRPEQNVYVERLGPLVPIPIVLRELDLKSDMDWEYLLNSFLAHPVANPFKGHEDKLRSLLNNGQVIFLLDGLDEVGRLDVRQALRMAVMYGMSQNPACRWLLTSRIVGYKDVQFHQSDLQTVIPWIEKKFIFDNEQMYPFANKLLDDASFFIPLEKADILDDQYIRLGQMRAISSPHSVPIVSSIFETSDIFSNPDQYPDIFHVAPFNDDQIERFAYNWYALRETVQAKYAPQARDLVERIRQGTGILRLARVPNLLTMMALIHRVRARLPHGRVLLYDEIARAYLESIDEFRGIREDAYTYKQKMKWLARVGFEMQCRRGKDNESQESREILVPQSEVINWIAEAMEHSGYPCSDYQKEAVEFVHFLGRRSGLLLPRGQKDGEEHFAFMHLSFQEFFAAYYLRERILSPSWGKKTTQDKPDGKTALRNYTQDKIWHETILLLFELLSDMSEWAETLLNDLFLKKVDQPIKTQRIYFELLSSLVVDPFTGLSTKLRRETLETLWNWELKLNLPNNWQNQEFSIANSLFAGEGELLKHSWQALGLLLKKKKQTTLYLHNCSQLTDLAPLKELANLNSLDLRGCTGVTDLAPLKELANLNSLYLIGCTGVTDLAPLKELANLNSLYLIGCTGVTDLAPLKELANLNSLYLIGCTGVTDLAPLKELANLNSLDLRGCTGVTDLAPLKELANLNSLDLDSCTGVTDLAPLKELANLNRLDLSGCTGVTDLAPLKELANLNSLYLIGCTGVTDLAPLKELANLNSLYLIDCTGVTDLAPLKELANLNRLDLDNCTGVTDLAPLKELANLNSLDLRGCTGVTDLAPLKELANLNSLYLSGCTGVTDLAPLKELANLNSLYLIDCTGVTDLVPLKELANLNSLDLEGCTGVTDLAPLKALANLNSLDLSGCTGVTDLAPLKELANLNSLDLIDCTGVTDLVPLKELANLNSLDLEGCTGVTDLAPLKALANLNSLDLSGCTGVTVIPKELERENLRIIR